MNISVLLQMAAEALGERNAVSCDEHSLSYSQLARAAGDVAGQLAGTGCRSIACLGVSSLANPIALFAAASAGVPYVPLNYRLTATEIDRLLARLPAPLLMLPEHLLERYRDRDGLMLVTVESLVAGVVEPAVSAAQTVESGTDPDAVAVQLFTSGTTGQPKAALLRHRNLVSYILGSVEFAAAVDDVALVTVPPYHIAGVSALLSSVYAGRRIVLLPEFTAAGWLELARREAVSHAFVVPTMLARIVDELQTRGQKSADLPALRAIAYGGGKMPRPVIERALALFPGVDFSNAYGLTETSSTITLLGPEEHRRAFAGDEQAQRRLSSVGRPLPGVELEIRDDQGRRLGPGQSGEIYVRGEQVAGEYAEQGSLLDADGWFATRDRGCLDAEGYLYLEGRADDIIVRGGENISPGEIEAVLLDHEGIADAAVVGLPSEQWGESVAAAVVTRSGKPLPVEALQALVKQRLRSSRVPEKIIFLAELPYNEMGKLLRRQVREHLQNQC